MDTAGTHITDRRYDAVCKLMFHRQAVELRRSNADIRIHRPQRSWRQRHRSRRTAQWSQVARRHRCIVQRDHGIVRRILDDVERDIAEVALVRDAEAAANRRLPISLDVIRKAHAWRHRPILRIPWTSIRTVRSRQHLPAANLRRYTRSRTREEIRLQARMIFEQYAKVVVTNPIVGDQL